MYGRHPHGMTRVGFCQESSPRDDPWPHVRQASSWYGPCQPCICVRQTSSCDDPCRVLPGLVTTGWSLAAYPASIHVGWPLPISREVCCFLTLSAMIVCHAALTKLQILHIIPHQEWVLQKILSSNKTPLLTLLPYLVVIVWCSQEEICFSLKTLSLLTCGCFFHTCI